MFQDHNLKQALKHVVSKKQFPCSLAKCILNLLLKLLDVGRKEQSLGHRCLDLQSKMKAKGLVASVLNYRLWDSHIEEMPYSLSCPWVVGFWLHECNTHEDLIIEILILM